MEIKFDDLLKQAVSRKASGDKSGIVDVAIVAFACGFVLTTITANCFEESKPTLPQSSEKK